MKIIKKMVNEILEEGMNIKIIAVITVMVILSISVIIALFPPPPPEEIEGVITNVSYIADTGSLFAPGIKKTVVTFEDGRVLVLNGLPRDNIILVKNKKNVILYSMTQKRIISAKVVE